MYSKYANIRDSRNATDYKVAKETGIPKQTFYAWKKGEYAPKYDKLKRIAEYLNTNVDAFV